MTNLRMPAEWEQQSAIWLSWPHNRETWPDNLPAAQTEFVELVRTIAEHQYVCVVGKNLASHPDIRELESNPNLRLYDFETNDAWIRDYGPTFVIQSHGPSLRPTLLGVDWNYNAWGGKYPPYDADQDIAQKILESIQTPRAQAGLCTEGGAIDSNGEGWILTTESCLLNPNRNPQITREQVESEFHARIGATRVLWLPGGEAVEGDDTDGHIDQLARFVAPRTIVMATPHTRSSVAAADNLEQNWAQLKRIQQELNLELIPLPLPSPRTYCGRRIPASYCNFLITNQRVIVPQFDDPADKNAIDTLRPLFPNREVIGLPSLELSVGLGSFHCLSQQQPKLPLSATA